MTHELVVMMANLFLILPDHWSLVLMGGELILNGDGSFITGIELSAELYGGEGE